MSKCNAQQLLQDGSCFLCLDAGIRQVLELQLLCEILNNGIGGGGSGVTGDGTLFPATSQTTLTLNTQSANLFFAGPSSGAAAVPTFRAMVNADLGTTLTPQFARVGLGVAADASLVLYASGPNNGAGINSFVARIDAPTSNPVLTLGANSNNNGGLISFFKNTTQLFFGVFGAAGMTLGNTGNVGIGGTLVVQGADLTLTTGVYKCQGSSGVSGSFDNTNTVTVVGGIVTNIA